MITVTGFILLYQDNIKACGFGKTFKFKYEFFAPRHQNFKSGFGFGFDTFTFWKKYFKLNISITDESVTTRTWWFAWLIPLSATEHVPQTVCPSHILATYCIKFILISSSHQPSPYRHFSSTFPDIAALQSVKQSFEIYLCNDRKQAGIWSIISLPVVVIWTAFFLFYFNLITVM